jgi:hypothetical protein
MSSASTNALERGIARAHAASGHLRAKRTGQEQSQELSQALFPSLSREQAQGRSRPGGNN